MTSEIKLIATDLDGTLLNSDQVVSEANLEALRHAIDSGIPFAIATGRRFGPFVQNIAASIGRPVFMVLCNGAVVIDSDSETVIRQKGLAREDMEWLVDIGCCRQNVHWNTWGDELSLLWKREDGPIIPDMPEDYWAPVPPPEDVLAHFSEYMFRGRVFGASRDVASLSELAASRGLEIQIFPYPNETDHCVEIMGRGVTKTSGLECLCKRLGIGLENIVAFGDEANDLDMLSKVGLGVAMANGSEDAKAAADIITVSNNEDGVAKGLKDCF